MSNVEMEPKAVENHLYTELVHPKIKAPSIHSKAACENIFFIEVKAKFKIIADVRNVL